MKDHIDPYEALGNAIIMQAVKDYRDALRKLKRGRKNTDAERTKAEVERFFRGGLFSAITEIDPEMLIRKLNEEVKS